MRRLIGIIRDKSNDETNHKISKSKAHYTNHSTGDDKCKYCAHYLNNNRCEIVEGIINPNGWCRYFEPVYMVP